MVAVVVVVVLSFLDRAPCRYRRSTGVQYQTQWHVHGTNRRRERRHVNGTRPQRHVNYIKRISAPFIVLFARVGVVVGASWNRCSLCFVPFTW